MFELSMRAYWPALGAFIPVALVGMVEKGVGTRALAIVAVAILSAILCAWFSVQAAMYRDLAGEIAAAEATPAAAS